MLNKNKIIPKRNIRIPIRNTADKYVPGIKTVSPGGWRAGFFRKALQSRPYNVFPVTRPTFNDLTDVGQTVNVPDAATNFPEILEVFQGVSRRWKPELENSGYPENYKVLTYEPEVRRTKLKHFWVNMCYRIKYNTAVCVIKKSENP